MRWSCRQYRGLLPGYIERELSPKQRERVSRHLNSCVECYAAYTAQRQIVRELEAGLPRLGTGSHAPRLDRIRAAVMTEMAQPRPQPKLYQARFSLAALVLVGALLLPWSMHGQVFSLPTPPQPEQIRPQGTAVVAVMPTEAATLTATLQANYAPATASQEATAGATNTP